MVLFFAVERFIAAAVYNNVVLLLQMDVAAPLLL
jgi:hypothetical protein